MRHTTPSLALAIALTLTVAVMASATGCNNGSSNDPGDGGGQGDAAVHPDGGAHPDAGPQPDGGGPGPDGGIDVVQQMCDRWASDRQDLAEGTWSGDVSTCDPGDVSANGRANALRLVNLYRWLAELPAVTTNAGLDSDAQACALMMTANGQLSHSPPSNWTCYSSEGASAAGSSNIATTPGVAAVDLYIVDPGNPTTIGHRRWILSNSLGTIGLGTTSSYSCMSVTGGGGNAGAAWTAWPPPGPFPYAAVQASWTSIDDTGWTLQSDTISLSGAQVAVTSGGQDRPVSVTQLSGGYGSSHAISFIPDGWTTQPDTTYSVTVTGISETIAYDVHVVSCN